MGKINKSRRHNSILQKRKRQEKIRKLKVKYLASEAKAREAILEKLIKMDAIPLNEIKSRKGK